MIITPEHVFSPSQINTVENCPYQWKGDRLHHPRITTETKYADAGTVVHRSIAEFYKVIDQEPNKGTIKGTFKTILERNWKASGLKGLDSRRDKSMSNFIKFECKRLDTWKQYKPTFVEQRLKAMINNINYYTIVDAYWERDATIVDWKTGNLNSIGITERIQGQVMKMVVEAYKKPVERVMFVALKIGLDLTMPATTYGFVEAKVKSIFERDRLNDFPKKRSSLCSWCGYSIRCNLEGRCLWM